MIFIKVDLPAPFSPMIAWTSPARKARLMSESTSTGPNAFVRPRVSSSGSAPRPASTTSV